MKRIAVTVGLVAALTLVAAAAFAWGPWSGRNFGPAGYGPGYGPPAWSPGVRPGYGPGLPVTSLSSDQITKIRKIHSDLYPQVTRIRTEMFTKAGELQALFRERTLNKTKIAAKQKEIAALQTQMQERVLAARTELAEVLTPEQRAQLPAFGPGIGAGFGPGMRFGPRMGFGPGVGFDPRW